MEYRCVAFPGAKWMKDVDVVGVVRVVLLELAKEIAESGALMGDVP